MALIVQKFGGSSVKDRDRIFNVARIVANTHNAGNDVVVVVSAQGDTTDDLIAKAGEITHNPSAREMDMLLASGEQISIALLAMALNELGCHAISLTGWQAGFRTDRAYTKARITRLETERIDRLDRHPLMILKRKPEGQRIDQESLQLGSRAENLRPVVIRFNSSDMHRSSEEMYYITSDELNKYAAQIFGIV